MSEYYKILKEAYDSIADKINIVPETAIVLGSGLGDFADQVKNPVYINYDEIKNFPTSTVAGHKGRFVLGYIEDVPVVVMQGRVHYYEGYDMKKVVMPVRLMKMMGAKKLVLTNAAGGIQSGIHRGDLMMIRDHISTFVPSPLIGENVDELGVRFPDMSEVYSERLRTIMKVAAMRNDINIKEGIYVQLSGPNYETPSEIQMLKKLGADAVGMSTVCEAMAARHAGMEICCVSCITNLACGLSDKELSHEEVQDTANLIAEKFQKLIHDFTVLSGDNYSGN